METLTDEELEELMRQRGLESLEEHIQFETMDGTVITETMQYRYGIDFNLGDWVSVYSKKINKMVKLQVISVKKSIVNGVEIFDIGFGKDRLKVNELGKWRLYR